MHREQTRDAVERRPEVVAVALVGRTRVDGRAHTQSVDPREVLTGESALGIEDRRHSTFRTRECRADRIANRFEHVTIMLDDGRVHQLIVSAQSILHRRPSRSQRFVLPSISENRNVTVPLGRSENGGLGSPRVAMRAKAFVLGALASAGIRRSTTAATSPQAPACDLSGYAPVRVTTIVGPLH